MTITLVRCEKSPYSPSVKPEQVQKLFLEAKEKLPDIRNYRQEKETT
jgi:hypothetical protein